MNILLRNNNSLLIAVAIWVGSSALSALYGDYKLAFVSTVVAILVVAIRALLNRIEELERK